MTVSVAVIIPYFNGSAFIERAVKSVMEQTVPPSEFIVVNDGSSPAERHFLEDLAGRYAFRIINQDNGGQGAARNTGAFASKAQYICFLDQDDFFLDNHIQILLSGVTAPGPRFGWVYADAYLADADGNVSRTHVIRDRPCNPKTDVCDMLRRDMFVVPSMSLISRHAFDAVNGFDPQFRGYEDDDLFLRIFRKGFSNHFVDQPVTVWCVRPDSTSGTILMCRSRVRYLKKLATMYPDQPEALRYPARDLLIPRFHPKIIGDTIDGIMGYNQNLSTHRDELLVIFQDYVEFVSKIPSIPRSFKIRLSFHLWLLETRSVILVKMVHFLLGSIKRLRIIPQSASN